MPYEQPSDAISAGSLSAEAATELFRPIRKAVAGEPGGGDTSTETDDSTEEPEERDDSATDEPAEDEDEGATERADDEESSEEPEEKTDESDEEEPLHEVKVDGKVHKVTLDQLKKDYSFTAHNTRRAQEISEKEQSLLMKESEVAENAKAYAEHLAQVKEALVALTPKEPDWDKLQKENPAKFAEQWAAWDKHKKGLEALDGERKKALEKVRDEENRQLAGHLYQENQKLEAAVPAWKDQKVRTKELNGMKEFARSQGFTDAELDAVIDHRTVLLLRAAYKHSVAQKARPENERKVAEVKALTPGSSASAPGRASVAAKALQKLDSSGTVEDAVAALQAQRAAGGRPRRR